LLTAALADKGAAAIIGETEGGWFWLTAVVIVAIVGDTRTSECRKNDGIKGDFRSGPSVPTVC
jgi:hypothetical protein